MYLRLFYLFLNKQVCRQLPTYAMYLLLCIGFFQYILISVALFFISSNIDLVPVLSIHCCGIITACLSSPWTIGFTGTHPSMAAVRTESTILSGARPHHRASAESRKRILTPPLPWTFPWCPADTRMLRIPIDFIFALQSSQYQPSL